MAEVTRRRFLILSAQAVAVAPMVACGDDDPQASATDTGADVGLDTAADAEADAADSGADAADAATDTTSEDAGADVTDTEVDAEPVASTRELLEVSKGPFAMITGLTSVRVRMEARVDASLTATLVTPGGERLSGATQRSTEEIELAWPIAALTSDHPDDPGEHTLYDILFTDLEPGERYTYELAVDDAAPAVGSFRAPAASGESFRAVWVADTMWPKSEDTGRMCGEAQADLFLHGGDIQYFSNPLDTWNGYFAYFAEALAHSAAHHAIGNHEYESFNEYDSHYVRLFAGQGEPTGTVEYFAFWFGGWRFIFMNTEVEWGTPGTAQSDWMEAELAAASATEGHLGTIVAFHRPVFTFGKSSPKLAERNYMHPFFKEHGVRLVLTGHNHGYERFVYDGIQYVVDGGGGAALTDIDDGKDAIAEARPEEIEMRVVASRTYGVLQLEFGTDGSLEATRTSIDDEVIDTFSA